MADFVGVEIEYRTPDRFGFDAEGDPHDAYAQSVQADIEAVFYVGEDTVRAAVGTMRLALIDIVGAEIAGSSLADVLDSHSTEWCTYFDVIDDKREPSRLLIIDRIELQPWGRGHGIGLHALARAIRTWGDDAPTQVVLTAYPPGQRGSAATAASRKLSRYWSQLGMTEVKGTTPPILIGFPEYRAMDDRLVELSASPTEWST